MKNRNRSLSVQNLLFVGVFLVISSYSHASAEESTTTPDTPSTTATTSAVVDVVVEPTSTPVVTPSAPVLAPDPTPEVPVVSPSFAVPVTTSRKHLDISAPHRITDLAVERVSSKALVVTWTIPYDDSGSIAGYDVRLSRSPLDEGTFASAISFPGTPTGGTSGDRDKMEFSQLPEGSTLYVAIKALDKAGNSSPISNILQATTKEGELALSDIQNQSRRVSGAPRAIAPTGAVDLSNVITPPNPSDTPDDTATYATVKLTLKTPDGLPVTFPVYVNFINNTTGLSYGGPSVNGLVSYKIPKGDYYTRMILMDTDYKEPKNPLFFHLNENEDKDLGVIKLSTTGLQDDTQSLLAEANQKGGTSKMLVLIVKLLGEIITILQKIALKVQA